MKNIGGFFELELSDNKNMADNILTLWCGRASFYLILETLNPSKVYIPFYTCDSLLEPLQKLNINYEFYEINTDFFPNNLPDLLENEYFLCINYFGIYQKNVTKLKKKYQEKLILDNTQSFFAECYPDICSFNSLRKFFGVPDGSFVNIPNSYNITDNFLPFDKFNIEHLINRLIGNQNLAYGQYQENENNFNCNTLGMSTFSKKMFNNIDLANVAKKRKENFKYLHSYLGKYNEIKNFDVDGVPFCYPFLSYLNTNRTELINKKIFIPLLWKDVLLRKNSGFEFERHISKQILPLPLDQRYSTKDMDFIIKNLINL